MKMVAEESIMNSDSYENSMQGFSARIKLCFSAFSFLLILGLASSSSAQTFSSGSTGADGAFAPASNQTVQLPEGGVFNFTTVNIPANVTITFKRNSKKPRKSGTLFKLE